MLFSIAEVNYLTPITNSALHVCLSVVGLRLFSDWPVADDIDKNAYRLIFLKLGKHCVTICPLCSDFAFCDAVQLALHISDSAHNYGALIGPSPKKSIIVDVALQRR